MWFNSCVYSEWNSNCWIMLHCGSPGDLKFPVTSVVMCHSLFAGAGTSEGWVQRENDWGGHLWGWQTLSERPTSRGQSAVHSLYCCATSERRSVWTYAGKHTNKTLTHLQFLYKYWLCIFNNVWLQWDLGAWLLWKLFELLVVISFTFS